MATGTGTVRSGSRPGLLHSADGTVAPVRSTPFDVRVFTRTAFGDRERDHPDTGTDLDPRVRRALAYLWEVERSATDTLRRVLATSTSREARYTAFLTTWAHDKFWFADHLCRVLGEEAPSSALPHHERTTRFDRRGRALDMFTRYVDPVWTTLLGERTTALHAARGLASESAELVALSRVVELAGGRLDDALQPVIARKREHHDFFFAEAHMRLADDAGAQRLVRILLARGFHPLRPGGLPAEDSHRFLRTLFAGGARERVVAWSDRDVLDLPGVAAPGPLERALGRERPVAPPERPVAGLAGVRPRDPTLGAAARLT